MKKVLIWIGITLAALYVFGLVLIVFNIGEQPSPPTKQPEPKAEPAPKPKHESSHKQDEEIPYSVAAARDEQPEQDPLSETEHLARSVAQEFRIARNSEGVLSQYAGRVTGFADDLDRFDFSIEVETDLNPDEPNIETIIERVGNDVLYVSDSRDVCKVDIMDADGERLIEQSIDGCTQTPYIG